jgi:hypothetical protein
MNKLLAIGMAIGLAMGLAACGAGGKDGSEPQYDFLDDVLSHVSITPPPDDLAEPREYFTEISGDTYKTEMTTIRLNGGM